MTQQGKFSFADTFSNQDSRQDKIQNRYPMIETTCGHTLDNETALATKSTDNWVTHTATIHNLEIKIWTFYDH